MAIRPILRALLVAIALVSVASPGLAQFPKRLQKGLKFYLDPQDSARFIQLAMVGQIWARYTENNPFTVVGSTRENSTVDLSIRRIRFVLSGSLTKRVNFFMQFGQNNLNYLSGRKSGSFFHDITMDYSFVETKFSLGFGLNGWNGPSRFSNISVPSILVLDPPNYQEVTNDTYDQFVRRLGIYAKGKLGKLDYRISVGKPFVIQTTTGSGTEPINANSAFSTLPPNLNYQGYFMYQFLDQESNFGPGNPGSYLGKKRVFNVGAGFNYQKNAMFHYGTVALKDTVKQDINLWAVDVFYDAPVNTSTGTAVSLYASYSGYDYGKDFIKVTGPDNPASGSSKTTGTAFEKSNYGNAFPYLGTGGIIYFQAAYKLRDNLLGEFGTLQPYVDVQHANYNRLSEPMTVYDIGFNWLIYGNNSKFTFNYQNRPYFAANAAGNLVQNARLSEWVIQYQVSF